MNPFALVFLVLAGVVACFHAISPVSEVHQLVAGGFSMGFAVLASILLVARLGIKGAHWGRLGWAVLGFWAFAFAWWAALGFEWRGRHDTLHLTTAAFLFLSALGVLGWKELKPLFWLIFGLAVVNAIYACLQVGTTYDVWGLNASYSAIGRVGGFFLYPNTFGTFVVLVGLVSATYFYNQRYWWGWLLLSGLLIGSVWLSGSRGSILSALAGVVVLLGMLVYLSRLDWKHLWRVCFILLGIAIPVIVWGLNGQGEQGGEEDVTSFDVARVTSVESYNSGATWRFWCQGLALEEWLNAPTANLILGSGPQSFEDVWDRNGGVNTLRNHSAHGDLAEWLLEYGIVGIGLLTLISIFFLLAVIKYPSPLAWGILPAVAFLFLRMISESELHSAHIGFFAVMLALLCIDYKSKARSTNKRFFLILPLLFVPFFLARATTQEIYSRTVMAGIDNVFANVPDANDIVSIAAGLVEVDPTNPNNVIIARRITVWGFAGLHDNIPVAIPLIKALCTPPYESGSSILRAGSLLMIMHAATGQEFEGTQLLGSQYADKPDYLWSRAVTLDLLEREEAADAWVKYKASPVTERDPFERIRRTSLDKNIKTILP